MSPTNVDSVVGDRLSTPSESCTERCTIPNPNNIDSKKREVLTRYVLICRKNRLCEQSCDCVFGEKLVKGGESFDLPREVDFNRR